MKDNYYPVWKKKSQFIEIDGIQVKQEPFILAGVHKSNAQEDSLQSR